MIPELTRFLIDMLLPCLPHYRWQSQPIQIQLILIQWWLSFNTIKDISIGFIDKLSKISNTLLVLDVTLLSKTETEYRYISQDYYKDGCQLSVLLQDCSPSFWSFPEWYSWHLNTNADNPESHLLIWECIWIYVTRLSTLKPQWYLNIQPLFPAQHSQQLYLKYSVQYKQSLI